MRQAKREITDRSEIERILATAPVVHIGMIDGDRPYVVPMNFGYADGSLYLHCAREGRKIDVLRANPLVCFEVVEYGQVQGGKLACDFSTRFASVIGYGRATFLDDPAQRREALDVLMSKFAKGPFEYRQGALAATAVIRIDISEMTGKRSAQPATENAMNKVDVFEGHFHCIGPDGSATVARWLDSGQVSGILCCTDLSSPHESFEQTNAELLKLSQARGRDVLPLLAMVHLNQPGWQEHASAWFDRYPTLVGIKLHPPISKYKLTSQLLDPLFEFAMERNICVASHTTPIPGYSAADFHDSLQRRRETKFIVYHASTHEQAAYLSVSFKNVYVEPTWLGFFPHLFELTRKLGGWRKLIGGTDGPGWFAGFEGSPYDDLVALARKHMDNDEQAVKGFCADNIRRFLSELR